jgi:phosphate uptake regulator
MFRDVVDAMKTWDRDLASSSFSLEDDVDQFMYFLHRVIRSAVTNPSLAAKLGLDMLDCLDYQKLVDHIERVADQINGIAHSIVFLHDKQDIVHEAEWGILTEAANITQSSYQQAVEFSLNKIIDNSNMIIDQQGRVRELLMKITPLPELVEHDRGSLTQLIVIRDNIQRISEYAADIAEITIDRAYKPLE